MITDEQIRDLALAAGFKLKQQADGSMGLHHYVYRFAHALLTCAMPAPGGQHYPAPPTMAIRWHDSPHAIHRAMWEGPAKANGLTYQDVLEGELEGETEDGQIVTMMVGDELAAMRLQKTWGFVDSNTGTIHAWVAPDADVADVLHMLAHEIGHATGAPTEGIAEEMRAEQFGLAAKMAYQMLRQRRGA